jgi:ABC-2 type transport system ATP-binding protein
VDPTPVHVGQASGRIEARDLTKRFGDTLAVNHLTFTVEPGRVTGFLGPNGAGKSTTMRLILGLDQPQGGTATIGGTTYHKLSRPLKTVGALLEARSVHTGRSARNHLLYLAQTQGLPSSRVDQVLDLVGLHAVARKRAGGFSLGMMQRLGIAAAMLGDPKVLLLDEPANGLDPEGVHWLRTLLRSMANAGRTVLVSSHILAEVAQTVDSVVILDRGRLVTQSTLADLTAGASRVVRVRTPRAAELAGLLTVEGARATVADTDRVEITGATSEQIGTVAAAHAIPIFETATEAADLEDIFLRLTAGAERSEVTS